MTGDKLSDEGGREDSAEREEDGGEDEEGERGGERREKDSETDKTTQRILTIMANFLDGEVHFVCVNLCISGFLTLANYLCHI